MLGKKFFMYKVYNYIQDMFIYIFLLINNFRLYKLNNNNKEINKEIKDN